jgi:acylglycerol lipase
MPMDNRVSCDASRSGAPGCASWSDGIPSVGVDVVHPSLSSSRRPNVPTRSRSSNRRRLEAPHRGLPARRPDSVHTRRVAGERPIGGIAGTARTRDGLQLRTYEWPAVGAPRAHLLLVHGIAEHAGRYPHVASRLASAGITTHAYDQRGFGRSGGHRAYVDRWSQYHDDLEDRLAAVRSMSRGLPVVLYGHSMGGLIVIGYALADPPRPLPDLLVLSSPAIDAVIPQWKRTLAPLLANLVPRFAVANGFPKGGLTSDLAVEAAYLADPVRVARSTARLGSAFFREQVRVQEILARGGPLPIPTYVLHGTDDPIVPEWASRSLEGRANVTRRVYQGLHHETHNEPSGAAVIDDTTRWIADRLEKIATG